MKIISFAPNGLTRVAIQALVLGTVHSIEMSLRLVRCLA
jgi:hypothetical protein